MSVPRQIRASDADREAAAEALREHFAAGRISSEELSARNAWRLYGPAPDPDRVQAALSHCGYGRGRRRAARAHRRGLP